MAAFGSVFYNGFFSPQVSHLLIDNVSSALCGWHDVS